MKRPWVESNIKHSSPQSTMELPSPESGTSEPSPLLRLPAELRNTIYELVASPECAKSGDKTILFEYTTAKNIYVSLAGVNRQCRDEYLPIFHDHITRTNSVQAKVRDLDFDALSRFLDALPSRRGMGKVEVTLVFNDPEFVVDKEGTMRWAKAAAHRRAAWTEVAYKVEVDWSRFTQGKFVAIDDALVRLALQTMGSVSMELKAISDETLAAADRRIRQNFVGSSWRP